MKVSSGDIYLSPIPRPSTEGLEWGYIYPGFMLEHLFGMDQEVQYRDSYNQVLRSQLSSHVLPFSAFVYYNFTRRLQQ